jgi:hypothetical protein
MSKKEASNEETLKESEWYREHDEEAVRFCSSFAGVIVSSNEMEGARKSMRVADKEERVDVAIAYQEFCFAADSVDWLWWPELSPHFTDDYFDHHSFRSRLGHRRENTVTLGICRYQNEAFLVLSRTGVFFDVGKDLELSEIQSHLITLVERDKELAIYRSNETIVFDAEKFRANPIVAVCSIRGLRTIRAFKNRYSAEIILMTQMRPYGFVREMVYDLKPFVYPGCKVLITKPKEVEMISTLPFAIEFELSEPKGFDRRDIEDAMFLLRKRLEGDVIKDCYVGYLSRRQKERNPYFPRNAGEKGQVGIVVVPSEEAYASYSEKGLTHPIPKRILLVLESRDFCGTIPISLENPIYWKARSNISLA